MEGEQRYEAEVAQKEPDLLAENLAVSPDRRSTREKIHTSAIILVAFLGVIAGYWQLSQGLSVSALLGKSTQTTQSPVAIIDSQKDTDADGLTDYEEQFTYKTSPYLEDSDSDGVSDKEEIDAGHDPNCPGAETCNTPIAAVDGTVPVTQDAANTTNPQLTPDQLRQMLKTSGVTDEQLATLSDADIVQLYQQASTQNTSQFNTGSPVVSGTTAQSQAAVGADLSSLSSSQLQGLQQLSGAQIRELMIKTDPQAAEVLKSVTDDQLKQMFAAQLQAKLNPSQ